MHDNAAALFVRLHALPHDPTSYGLTHGDLHHNNFLLEGDVIHPFDFDDCEYGWFASDVAIALYYAAGFDTAAGLARWTGMDRRSFSSHFLKHFMADYRTEHRLEPGWLLHIPDFLRLRALIMYVIGRQHLDMNSITQLERTELMFYRDAIVDDAWADESRVDAAR